MAAGGPLWGFGDNDYGQLGDNSTTDRSSPVSIIGGHSFVDVSSMATHSIGLDISGVVWTWGRNDKGQLGDGTTTNKSSPISILRSGSYTQIDSGAYSSYALDSNGMVWAWGDNDNGHLGDNSTTDRSSPVSIVRAGSYVAVTGSDNNGMALDNQGKVWTWGLNTYGQLGNNSTDSQSSPVSVLGDRSYIAIDSGYYFNMALDSEGMIWTWGYNDYGRLGINAAGNRSSPVSIVRSGSYIAIAAMRDGALALASDGTLWAWGYNDTGELGDNTRTGRSSPVSVLGSGDIQFQGISGKRVSSYAIDSDGIVYSWGSNNAGQLGDNTKTNRSSPVSVGLLNAAAGECRLVAGGQTAFAITGTAYQAPSITRQPQSQLKRVGNDVTFSPTVTGTTPLTYQWMKNGSDISGETSSTLTLTDLTEADQANYNFMVENEFLRLSTLGRVVSSSAFLSIGFEPGPGGNASPRDRIGQPPLSSRDPRSAQEIFQGTFDFSVNQDKKARKSVVEKR